MNHDVLHARDQCYLALDLLTPNCGEATPTEGGPTTSVRRVRGLAHGAAGALEQGTRSLNLRSCCFGCVSEGGKVAHLATGPCVALSV